MSLNHYTMKLRTAFVRDELKALGMVLRRKDGEYRVNFRGGSEETAYYTDSLEDALGTARAMFDADSKRHEV